MLQVPLLARTSAPRALEPGGDPTGVAAQGAEGTVPWSTCRREKRAGICSAPSPLCPLPQWALSGGTPCLSIGATQKSRLQAQGWHFLHKPRQLGAGGEMPSRAEEGGRRQEARESAQCVPHTLFCPSIKLTPCAQPQPFCPAWGIPQPVFLRKVLGTAH